MGTEAAIGLGSNIGDRMAYLITAVSKMEKIAGTTLLAKSAIYETEPVEVPPEFSQLKFLNAVALFNVDLDVEAWSAAIHAIEDDMLRVREERPHTPRTIDLDLLYFGNVTMNRPHLHLPHPQCTSRRFVCKPLAELRPYLILPHETKPLSEILAELPAGPAVIPFKEMW